MGLLVAVSGMGLTARAEVSVVANSTLEPNALNICLIAFSSAQGPITIDAHVTGLHGWSCRQGFVDGYETVIVACTFDRVASATEIKIGTIKAFIADTENSLKRVSV